MIIIVTMFLKGRDRVEAVQKRKDCPLASIWILGDLGSIPCSMTDFLCDLGQVTLSFCLNSPSAKMGII